MKEQLQDNVTTPGVSRRKFLTYAGGLAGATVLLDACSKDDDNEPTLTDRVELGQGDIGLMNYAYALEQLEAAFYVQVLAKPYADMWKEEKQLFEDLRDHEIAHREFLKNFLAAQAIPSLEFDFSSVNFSSKDSVFAAARTIEELGVSAYNGAGKLFTLPENLMLISKIASVEARHAAIIRNNISKASFSDTTDANGLDTGKMPIEVLQLAKPFMKSNVNAANLPKS